MHDQSGEMQNDSAPPPRLAVARYFAVLAVIGTALGGVIWYAVQQGGANEDPERGGGSPPPKTGTHSPLALPAIARTRFRNASTSVGYVGNSACIECHKNEHQSYLQTTHSRALAGIEVAKEPPDGDFHHEISGRHYRVYRDGQALRHREYILDDDGREVVLADHAVKYAMGSGNYSRSYLVDIDGFLFESPITWFSRAQKWKMSPGYEDDSVQPGFARPIQAACMGCHSGRVETVGQGYHRLKVSEMAISCERCHGPGELHVKERQAKLPIKGDFDDTIVNLRHLSRQRQEDVCTQCHLQSSSKVNIRGRNLDDFRPGMRMEDFTIGFRVDRPDSAMTVVGHVEQMRLSRCYTQSKTMTCTSCHDPHSLPAEEEKVEHYKAKCFECHKSDSCGLPVKTRLQQQKQDNCVACHMPTGPTEIPHFAFTHHRIGIHAGQTWKPKKPRYSQSDRLAPVSTIAHLPEIERTRVLGLALDEHSGKLMGKDGNPRLAAMYREEGRRMLEKCAAAGLRDPEVDTVLSMIYLPRDTEKSMSHARKALESKEITSKARRYALFTLASMSFRKGRLDEALPAIQKLLETERSEFSLMMMAVYQRETGNLPEAAKHVTQAIRIVPHSAELHEFAAAVYQKMADAKQSAFHTQRAKLLRRKVPQARITIVPRVGK